MQNIAISKQQNPTYITFRAKLPTKKLAAAAIASVAAAGIVSSNNNDLFNEFAEDDKRIEEYLLRAIQTQERISIQKFSDDLNIDKERCRNRISKGYLRDLWLQTNHSGIRRQNAKDEAIIENQKRLGRINSELSRIVKEAYKNKTPLTYSQAARILGIRPQGVRHRIQLNKKLLDMWNQIEHPRVTEESENINQQIADIINEVKLSGRTINYQTIADRLGLSYPAVAQRVRDIPKLKSLMAQIGYSKITEESQDINEKIAGIIEKSIAENSRVSIRDIAEQTGITIPVVKARLKKHPILANLWAKIPRLQSYAPKSEKTLKAENQLRIAMEAYIASKTPVLLKELSEITGIPYRACMRYVETNLELKALWKKVHKKNVGGLRDYVKDENENLIRLMESYITQGIRADGIQISKETGMSLDKFRAKLKHYPDVKAVWQRLKELDKAASTDVDKQIESILEYAVKNRIGLSVRKIERVTGLSKNVCFIRIYKNNKLNELWSQIKEFEKQSVKEKHKKIETILRKSIAKNYSIRIYDIAKITGYNFGDCYNILSKVPKLKALWDKIDHSRVKKETKELVNEIQDILIEANNSGRRISVNDIVEFTQNSYDSVRYSIHASEKLMELWKENKKTRYSLLKQIHSLKQNKLSEEEIMNELDLEDDVFAGLMSEYKDLSRVIKLQKDKNISDDEYISWAVLSKREYELVTSMIFEKMGYHAVATRYMADGGVDVIAQKDGKSAIIECIHNLAYSERAKEVLALEGIRSANNIDEAILVTGVGVLKNAEDCINNINKHRPNSFKILTLTEMIKLAKKYDIDINKDINDIEENDETMLDYDISNWYFKKSDKISDKVRKKWLNIPQKEYEKRIADYFTNKGYDVTSITRTVGLKGFYLLKKDGEKIVIDCGVRNNIPKIDDVRSLYGCKNAFEADKVILIGTSGVSASEKSYIDLINNQDDKNGTFGTISFDKIIEIIEDK